VRVDPSATASGDLRGREMSRRRRAGAGWELLEARTVCMELSSSFVSDVSSKLR
jgi:hypothetical protein